MSNKKGLSQYIRYPLILGIVCVACSGILATINYFTAPIIKENEERKANEAIYNMASQVGLSNPTLTDMPYGEGESNSYVNDRKKIEGNNEVYYYYSASSAKGYSGVVNYSVLVSSDVEIVTYTFLGGDEDSLGLSAARTINITPNNPFTEASSINAANGFIPSSASAAATLPAIELSFFAILEEVDVLVNGASTLSPAQELLDSVGITVEGDFETLDYTGEKPAFVHLRESLTEGGSTYYYYEAETVQTYFDPAVFEVIVEGDEIIAYGFISCRDSIGMGLARNVSITPSNPYTSGSSIDGNFEIDSGATSVETYTALQVAFDAILAEVSAL